MKAKRCITVLFLITLSVLFLSGCSTQMGAPKIALSMGEGGQDTGSTHCSCMRGGTPRNWLFGVPHGH